MGGMLAQLSPTSEFNIPHRFDAFIDAAQQITYTQAILSNKEEAAAKIDQILVYCISKVHIYIAYLWKRGKY